MPWRYNYYRPRRYRIRYRRFRNAFWRKPRWRWRWRRRQTVRKRKLQSLKIRQYQPKAIRKCKIKGLLPLFWGTPERFVNNYELYENTAAPEKLPSGGLFCIKNINLESLYAEHRYCRNVWTKTNNDLPFVRYTGATIKLYRSESIDYIVSFDNSLPMTASLDMYETMHPGIHGMLKNKIIVTSNKHHHRKPYKKIKIRPPNPLQNKWYFATDISQVPLCQLRASATTFDEYYVNNKSVSTTMTIFYLNPGAITNTNFQPNKAQGYYARKHEGTKIYLYSPGKYAITFETTKFTQLIFLGNTSLNQEGIQFPPKNSDPQEKYIQKYPWAKWGNPFFKKYLTGEYKVYFSTMTYIQVVQKIVNHNNPAITAGDSFTETQLIHNFRYNPFNDQGLHNSIYLTSARDTTDDWRKPQSEDLQQNGLPLWILTFGFTDYEKKIKKAKNVDTDWLVVLTHNVQTVTSEDIIPILDSSFINGNSPYENGPSPADHDRWYPCTQFQQITLNNIALSGPGAPRIPTLQAVEAKIDYTFYFKWGGNLPPMSTISDPKNFPDYHLPTNFIKTNSLQNPATRPEALLYSFDERRGQLTTKALHRLQTDWETKTISFTDASRFQPTIQTKEKETSETDSSEEEETTENLLQQLNKQRLKQKQLKLKILQLMGITQK
nr:MAG: ORF1 [TTV-like mini virus]